MSRVTCTLTMNLYLNHDHLVIKYKTKTFLELYKQLKLRALFGVIAGYFEN